MNAKALFFNQFHYYIDGLDELGYDLINHFITINQLFAKQYQFLKVIYKRSASDYTYKVLILIVQDYQTKNKYVLKLSQKLQTFSTNLTAKHHQLITKEYDLHQTAYNTDSRHVLAIYGHWRLVYYKAKIHHHYLVLLLEKGISLDKLYQNDTLIKRDDYQSIVIKFYLDALKTLIKFQNNKLLHRDVKPENLYLANGSVKIGDFDTSKNNVDSTQYQTTVSTPLYAAPEVYHDGHHPACYGFKSQVFSLAVAIGITLNKGNLIGVEPQESLEIKNDINKYNFYNLHRTSPKFKCKPLLNKQDPLNDILMKGLRYNPKQRLSMNEFEKQLSGYLNNDLTENKKITFNFKYIYFLLLVCLLIYFLGGVLNAYTY